MSLESFVRWVKNTILILLADPFLMLKHAMKGKEVRNPGVALASIYSPLALYLAYPYLGIPLPIIMFFIGYWLRFSIELITVQVKLEEIGHRSGFSIIDEIIKEYNGRFYVAGLDREQAYGFIIEFGEKNGMSLAPVVRKHRGLVLVDLERTALENQIKPRELAEKCRQEFESLGFTTSDAEDGLCSSGKEE